MLNFLVSNWLNILLVLVGLSAFGVYFWQKHDQVRTAATLVLSEIDSIEKRVSSLADESQLNHIAIYYSQSVLSKNYWDEHKHFLIKYLSKSEIELVSHFFENAQQIESARSDILDSIHNDWNHASLVEHYFAATFTIKILNSEQPLLQTQNGVYNLIEYLERFKNQYGALDLALTANLSINLLTNYLRNFNILSGTTAYEKIRKLSFSK